MNSSTGRFLIIGVWAATILLGTASFVRAKVSLTLVAEGQPKAVIVVPSSSVTKAIDGDAARLLADHLFLMSGARLPVLRESDLGASSVYDGRIVPEPGKAPAGVEAFVLVGEGELARKIGATAEGLGPGGVLVKTVGNAVILLGPRGTSDPCGTRYAVIDFLEQLGVRYLWPGELGRVIPSRRTVTIGPLNVRFTPPIGQRALRLVGLSERAKIGLGYLDISVDQWTETNRNALVVEGGVSWATWQRLGGNLGINGGHAGGGLEGGWANHGAAHPDWFALQTDGTRDQSKAGDRWRLCVSNTGLVEQVAHDIIERVNRNPATKSVSLNPNDGGLSNFCMCDACRKLDPPNGPKIKMLLFDKVGESALKEIEYVSLTDRYVHYWNAVAERVTRAHPHLLFVVDAYSYYSQPPVRKKLHPNLVVRYVPETTQGWGGWQKAGASRFFWRPNILMHGYKDGKLYVMVRQLADTVGFLAKRGMLAVDCDGVMGNWSVQGINYYAAARLSWNPRLTANEILDDFCRHGFGPAAKPVREYFLKAQAITEEPKREFTPKRVRTLRALLDTASRAAGADETIRARVRFLRLGLRFTELQQTLDDMAARAKENDATVDRARARQLIELNFFTMRDVVFHHHFAIFAPYLAYGSGNFSKWESIGGRGYRPAKDTLNHFDASKHSLTGDEQNLDDMLAALGLGGDAAPSNDARPSKNMSTKLPVETDDQGRVIEAPKP